MVIKAVKRLKVWCSTRSIPLLQPLLAAPRGRAGTCWVPSTW